MVSVEDFMGALERALEDVLSDEVDIDMDDEEELDAAVKTRRFKLTGNSRYFKVRLEEADTTKPQRIEGFHFLFVPKGMRIK